MLDTDTKRRIDTARDILVGKVPDPKSQVEQITIALIYKFMDDMGPSPRNSAANGSSLPATTPATAGPSSWLHRSVATKCLASAANRASSSWRSGNIQGTSLASVPWRGILREDSRFQIQDSRFKRTGQILHLESEFLNLRLSADECFGICVACAFTVYSGINSLIVSAHLFISATPTLSHV